jgi:hypothetical protein
MTDSLRLDSEAYSDRSRQDSFSLRDRVQVSSLRGKDRVSSLRDRDQAPLRDRDLVQGLRRAVHRHLFRSRLRHSRQPEYLQLIPVL